MNAKPFLVLVLCGAVGLGTVGCTFPSRGPVYSRGSAGLTMKVETGDVVSVREATISGRTTIIGTGGGAIVGHAVGTGIGHGVGTTIASAAGAVGGAIAGEATEELATRKAAQEVVVKLENGSTIVVVQAVGPDGPLAPGEHLQVLQNGGESVLRRF